jgi:hypothetical protein
LAVSGRDLQADPSRPGAGRLFVRRPAITGNEAQFTSAGETFPAGRKHRIIELVAVEGVDLERDVEFGFTAALGDLRPL